MSNRIPKKLKLVPAVLVLLLVVIGASEQRAYSAAPFYEGKAIRIVVGTAPGGGYDTYTRLIARHFGKYIPGSPAIVVDNMPGAGGLVAANHQGRQTRRLDDRPFRRRAIFTAAPRQAGHRVRCAQV